MTDQPKNTEFVIIRHKQNSSPYMSIVRGKNLPKEFKRLGDDYVFKGTYRGCDEYWVKI